MRDYGTVSPQFWVRGTGKQLRGDAGAQVVALYLMTSPHANMIGIYYCPVDYIAKETGLSIEGASKALQRLASLDFCTYEQESELVFVHRLATYQIGEELSPSDKRVKGVINELAKVPQGACWQAFRARYAVQYHLPIPGDKPLPSPSKGATEAPSKPETETETETDRAPSAKTRKSQLPSNFKVSDRVRVWAGERGFGDLDRHLEGFVSYVKRNAKTYADWDEALMTAIRDDWAKVGKRPANDDPYGLKSAL